MNSAKIGKVQKLNSEINNFKSAYEGSGKLWGPSDEPVTSESLLAFLIEHPYLQEIAAKVAELDC